ncbi:hypothetical protein ACYOEI_06650 [Singulisphaera rosea]
MHSRRKMAFLVTAGGILLGSLSLPGCGDDSKTTGTQLQLTAKDKAQIEGMRAAMKAQRATQKQERIDRRKKK